MNASLPIIDDSSGDMTQCMPLRAGEPLDVATFHSLRSQAVLEGCKWDPQVGDASTLASFPLLISKSEWRRLASWSERLASEAVAAELELVTEHPYLLDRLGLPGPVRRALRQNTPLTTPALRW